ncbi:Hpt domain-containing protein [Labilibaculum sp.]|uniref:Hpt domain-containing protein n=1 Tax=Labilibaculum sp. TaxID=2060723 RepID=UPI0035682B0F
MPQIAFSKCTTGKQAIELIIKENFELIISNYQLDDQNGIELNQSIESARQYYANTDPKKIKLLILTSNSSEEQACKEHELLYYPKHLNLKSLLVKLTGLNTEPTRESEEVPIIDFKDLFIRVDNNREFIQTVIEKFFEIRESRINDIRVPLLNKEFKQAKDSAHKLKGVLANFSMMKARTTIIELEKLLLDNQEELSLQKLDQLIKEIETARQFYLDNLDQFKN